MGEKQKNNILKHMNELANKIDEKLEGKPLKRENMMYYDDFEFKGSNLAVKNVYIVEISNEKGIIYEIYDENNKQIAAVNEKGKVHFSPEFIEQLKQIDIRYFEQLNLEDLSFELPQELNENDIVLTREESKGNLDTDKEGKINKDKENKLEKDEEQKEEQKEKEEPEKETEEEKKKKTATALEIDEKQIKSISTINPNQKITDKYSLRDMMPEASGYMAISIAYTNQGQFTVLGVKDDGTREKINSIESIEGVATSKSVISINEDGSKVEEKQVKGLMRINARNRDDGLSISIGDYGMMNIDYVSNVMDKQNRRSTPIRTREAENQRIANAQVRENAVDSKEEMTREGRIYRNKQEEGIDPQTLDGIETDNVYGNITLEELKEIIKEEALEKGDMSKSETQEFIRSEISKSGLDLSDKEIENAVEDVEEEILDESRFPRREGKI